LCCGHHHRIASRQAKMAKTFSDKDNDRVDRQTVMSCLRFSQQHSAKPTHKDMARNNTVDFEHALAETQNIEYNQSIINHHILSQPFYSSS
jgi:hypothetical protein